MPQYPAEIANHIAAMCVNSFECIPAIRFFRFASTATSHAMWIVSNIPRTNKPVERTASGAADKIMNKIWPAEKSDTF